MTRTALLAILAASSPNGATAQVDGHVSLMVDALPDGGDAPGGQPSGEVRARLFVEHRRTVGDHLRVQLSGHVDGLMATREAGAMRRVVRDAIARPLEAFAEVVTSRFELRAGASRIVWGRLDEFQPTDVVNPIDLTRFLLEGRSEARLSVGVARGRVFLPRTTTLDVLYVPTFRASRFDQLDEPTSPFNLTRAGAVSLRRLEPSRTWGNAQGGARLTTTLGRVDVGASFYRGFRSFPLVVGEVTPSTVPLRTDAIAPPTLEGRFPRFTMVGADFETTRGAWGLRGELAVFVDDRLQSTRQVVGVPGHSLEGGVGVDRRAGAYRLAFNALVSRRSPDGNDPVGARFAGDDEVDRADVLLVAALDRSFARETRTLRVFSAVDPVDRTTFVRAIAAVSVRDNVWVEGSGGLFTGSSFDTIGRLRHRDFACARLKVYF